jgi:ribose 5-phosphate isomerase A
MIEKAKKLAGERAADLVESGQVVGLGTGSTAYFAIMRLAERVSSGLEIRGIPTSEASATLARDNNIPLISFSDTVSIDITIDGADEVDAAFNLIKGGGGALLREKIVAGATQKQIIVADESKLKKTLGAFPLPVEVTRFGWEATTSHITELGCTPEIRIADGSPFVTDNGNFILDCPFPEIANPADLETALRSIPGVVECGLFVDLTDRVIIGKNDGTIEELTEPSK